MRWLSLALLLLASTGTAARAELLAPTEVFRLGNGLKVILHEDHATPKIAVVAYIAVGSRDEEPGRTGFAHLFEHLMFKGTPAIPDGRMDALLEEGGGFSTAFTSTDQTVYIEWATSSYLETALWIEGDRLTTLLAAFDDKKLANQRDVVRNERRQALDNRPYGEARKLLGEALWPAGHGYHWRTIGSHEDLVAASVDDVKRFFRKWYVPVNITIVVAGDFDRARARELVIEHLGTVPRAAGPERRQIPDPPPLAGPVRVDATDDVVVPRVHLAWRGPRFLAGDEAAVELGAMILGSGKASRLYERLVYRDRLAQDVSAYLSSGELGGELVAVATAKPGVPAARLEAAMLEEIARLSREPPSAEEVARVQNLREARFLSGLESVQDRAVQFAVYDRTAGDPAFASKDLARYRAVTAADVGRVVATWLAPERRVTLVISPEKGR